MGMETAAIALATVAVGAEVGKMGFEIQAANEQKAALDLQAKQMRLNAQQKTLANIDVMEKVLDAQVAHQSTTGTAFSSPSFNAIQRSTLNIGAKRQKNIDIEGKIAEENIATEKRNVRHSLFAKLFGDVTQGAITAFGVYSKMPTLEG